VTRELTGRVEHQAVHVVHCFRVVTTQLTGTTPVTCAPERGVPEERTQPVVTQPCLYVELAAASVAFID
jgi:hypothetical protein